MSMPLRVVGLSILLLFGAAASDGAVSIPDPTTSEIPDLLISGASFVVKIRDVANNPIPMAVIEIHTSGTGICPYADDPKVICIGPMAVGQADAAGVKDMGFTYGGYEENPEVKIFADGLHLKSVRAISVDLNSDGGVDGADLNIFALIFLNVPNAPPVIAADFNDDGQVDGGDLAIWATAFLSGGGLHALCPCP